MRAKKGASVARRPSTRLQSNGAGKCVPRFGTKVVTFLVRTCVSIRTDETPLVSRLLQMDCWEWLCKQCFIKTQDLGNDVFNVHVVPRPDGTLGVANSAAVGIPSVTACAFAKLPVIKDDSGGRRP